MNSKDCDYKIIEGPDAEGRVRLQCADCGRLWPSKNREPKAIKPGERVRGIGCNPARRAQRLASQRLANSPRMAGQRIASCPESCINRAAVAQAKLIAELSAAQLKAKDHELKAVIKRMLEHAQRNEIDKRFFQQARELAIKQAIEEGKQSE